MSFDIKDRFKDEPDGVIVFSVEQLVRSDDGISVVGNIYDGQTDPYAKLKMLCALADTAADYMIEKLDKLREAVKIEEDQHTEVGKAMLDTCTKLDAYFGEIKKNADAAARCF